jgi:mycoredoxin
VQIRTLVVFKCFNGGKEETGMTQPLTMYTTPWCGYCRRLKSQLAREGIEITEVDIEREPDAAEYVMTVNGGYQTVPTVLFPDGSTLTNPSVQAIKQRLEELAAPLCPN